MREDQDVPLAPLTTLRVGGPARRMLEATNADEVVAAVREVDAAGEPLLVLAGGSNVVVADAGFAGTVVRVATRGVEIADGDEDRVEVLVAAGEPWDGIVERCVSEGLAGVECLSGIPGSTGATPIQNVGAYGQDVSETVLGVRVYDRDSDGVRDLTPAECAFAYRDSALKHEDRRAVLGVTFGLRRAPASGPLRYAELARTLDLPVGAGAPLAEVRDAVLALRRGKGMVLDPDDPDTTSVGSFFTNPILTPEAFATLRDRAARHGGGAGSPPAFPELDGRIKTSAAWLIEQAGFHRGHGDDRVAVSGKHTLALTNRGGATAAELVALAREIRDGVRDAFGIELVPEPVFVGHAF